MREISLEKAKEIMQMFRDNPLTEHEEFLFVNRTEELNILKNTGRLIEKSIYGIAGETGSGKTTLFNMLNFSNELVQKIIVHNTEKGSNETIITDLLYKLCATILQNVNLSFAHKQARQIINFVEQEELKGKEAGIKLGKIIEGESRWTRTVISRVTLTTIKNKLREIIEAISCKEKILLCIDEIDKEAKKDVMTILDSIKDVLIHRNIAVIVALPQIMYDEYCKDRVGLLREGNLENILKDIIPLHGMSSEDIGKLLDKRIKKFPEVLPDAVKEIVIDFAGGNPREALLLCQNSLLRKRFIIPYRKDDFVLQIKDIKNEMRKFLSTQIEHLRLSKREKEVIQLLSLKEKIKKNEVIELISREANIPKPTIYIAIKNLLNKKCLIETEEEFYEVDGRVKLYYKYCL